jgi:hypothetical protein
MLPPIVIESPLSALDGGRCTMRFVVLTVVSVGVSLLLAACCSSEGKVGLNDECIKESKDRDESCHPALLCVADCMGCTAYCRDKSHPKVRDCVNKGLCVREEHEKLGW